MAKTNLIDFTNVIQWLADECKKRGLNMREVVKHANVAKSTPENWLKKNPKQFQNLEALIKSMDELECLNKELAKLKSKYGHE